MYDAEEAEFHILQRMLQWCSGKWAFEIQYKSQHQLNMCNSGRPVTNGVIRSGEWFIARISLPGAVYREYKTDQD